MEYLTLALAALAFAVSLVSVYYTHKLKKLRRRNDKAEGLR